MADFTLVISEIEDALTPLLTTLSRWQTSWNSERFLLSEVRWKLAA